MSSNETTLNFVKFGEDVGEFLQQAFENAKSKELDVELVSGQQLMEKGVEEDQVVFITDEFTGDVFELLSAHKKRIFGPHCVLQCLANGMPLPNSIHPVYSLAMTGTLVSCTSIAKPLREKLKQLIEHMNGVFARDLTNEVTHLVAGEVGSAKYASAAKLRKPVVLPSWVEEAWQQTQKNYHFEATDSQFVDKHRCPILKGCSVCVSGLNGRRKEEIKRLVEQHGGIYLADLKLKATTHLLIENPTGQKYHFALRWSVYCVQPEWLYDCISTGSWIEETPYLVRSATNSTSNATLSTTTVNATMNRTVSSSEVSRKAAQAAKQSSENFGNKDLLDESLKRVQTSGLKRLNKSKHAANKTLPCDYNVRIPSGEQFLDGCRLFLTGFNDSQLEYLQKIINAGGATRFDHVNPSVSHIVVGDKPAQDIEKLINSEFSPHVVTVHWLLESCRQVKCLPEQEYCYLESNEVFEDDGKIAKEKIDKEKKVTEENRDDEILKQYLNVIHSNNESTTVKDSTSKREIETNDGKCVDKQKENDHHDKSDSADETKGEQQDVLHGLKFRLDGFTEEQTTQLQDDIEIYGGNVLSNISKTIADFLVVPLNYECKNNRAKTVVTYCWLERCVECDEILDPNREFLFTPFSLPEDVFPLQDCVISISQYADIEREHLMHLIAVLGGHFQEYFSRSAKTNILANTHLILQEPLGSKYEAAVNWKIPALTADWLYECARHSRKVPEAPYTLTVGKSPGVARGQSELDMGQTGNAEQEQLENNRNSVFNAFTVPQARGVKEVGGDYHKEIGNKPEASSNNQKTRDKEVTAAPSNKQPMSLKVPPLFGKPQPPSFDLTDVMEYLQSPCTSSGSSSAHSRLSRGSRNSFLMDDYLQEHLQAALKNAGNLVESCKDAPEKSTVEEKRSFVDKEESTVNKLEYAGNKERSTVDNKGCADDKKGSTVNKLQYAGNKERSTVDNEGCADDKEGSAVDMEDHGEKENDSSFLRGVVLTVSKKCAKQLSDIYNMVTLTGAQYRDSLDKNCTHLIHEGRLTKEQTKAKSRGVHVVSPHWLYDSIEQRCHLDESLYPPGYNPKFTLSVVKTRRSTRSSKDVKDVTNVDVSKVKIDNADRTSPDTQNDEITRNEEEEQTTPKAVADDSTKEFPMDDLKLSELEAIAAMSQSSVQSDSLRTREEIKQLQDLMESMKSTRRRSSRLHNSGNSGHSRNSSESSEARNSRRPSSRLRSLRSSKDNSEDDDDNDHAQKGEITYDDPKSRHERQKIIAQLEDCSPKINKDSNRRVNKPREKDDCTNQKQGIKKEPVSPTSPLYSSTPTAPPVALHITSTSNLPEPVSLLDPAEEIVRVAEKPPPKFTLSTMSQQEKIDYGALIENLGGLVFDSQFFNHASRHTVAGQLNRNEKCLSSIAAGNWLLRKSYLEECRRAGCFVDEEPHEWGAEIPGESLTSLAVASRRWRIELAKKSARYKKKFGAFQDWKILLCVEENKAGSFRRMLEAGGAKVLGTKPPFQTIAEVTHAFVSPGASLVSSIGFDRLEQAGILVLRTEYIVDYLTAGNTARDTSKYLYRPTNLSSRKRKQHDSSFPETPEKKKRVT